MGYRNFEFKVTVYVVMIAAPSTVFILSIHLSHLLVTHITLALIWIAQVIGLIYYVKRTNRELAIFFESFQFADDLVTFNPNQSKAFEPLYSQFNRITREFRRAKKEKEIEHQYFINTVKHVPTGLISFDPNGEIEIFNDAAADLLHRPVLRNIIDLNRVQDELGDQLLSIQPGETITTKIHAENNINIILLKAAEFKFESREIKLVSLQSITPELEEGELEAWQKLIRVLTHEIVNSVSPITLLSTTLISTFENEEGRVSMNDLSDEKVSQSIQGLNAIKKRSAGLSRFIESYRSIANVPQPHLEEFKVIELFEQVEILLRKDMESREVDFSFDVDPDSLSLEGDEKLIEQVLINLVKNAMEALVVETNKKIQLKAFSMDREIILKVIDNGSGIPTDEIGNIFTPFYTTKKEGSGIGLSLSRQIMKAHKGKLLVRSVPGQTEFSMIF